MRTLAFTLCRKVILEAMKFSAYVLFSVIIAAQVFEAPPRPSQQLTSGDYGDLCQRELASHACLWPLLRSVTVVDKDASILQYALEYIGV